MKLVQNLSQLECSEYDVFNPELTNISFGDNSTPGVFDDDVVNFDLNPNPGSGTYGLQVLGGRRMEFIRKQNTISVLSMQGLDMHLPLV